MATISEADVEGILDACSRNAEAITQSLNQCFDLQLRLGAGDSLPWNADDVPLPYVGPGIAVVLQFGESSVACLVPESLPLPVWYTLPNDSQQSRLQTLAMEWSMNLLPPSLEAESFRTVAVSNLKAGLVEGAPPEWAAVLQFPVFRSNAEPGVPPTSSLLLVAPLQKPAFQTSNVMDVRKPAEPAAGPKAATPAATGGGAPSPAVPPRANVASDSAAKSRRVLGLPVKVSVRLAEKKIEVGQLLAIAPGALITFNKSCEDLLDLYVNNHRFCRGEAVKIGEKFGLKVNELGVVEQREAKIFA